jgi:hypothetical protein
MEGYLTRKMQLARRLGARRFEAQGLEMKARVLLDTGRRKEAADILQEALAICREVGTQFCGPKVAGALARAVEDAKTRTAVLTEGQEMLSRGAVGHNHLWFYRDAIEAVLSVGDGAGALIYVRALEDYTRAEPLPWSDLFAKSEVGCSLGLYKVLTKILKPNSRGSGLHWSTQDSNRSLLR